MELKIKDINAPAGLELLARNAIKRLHIGVGIELLVKALYLRRGYQINKLKRPNLKDALRPPYRFEEVPPHSIRERDSFTLGALLDSLHKVRPALTHLAVIQRGFRIALVFRNKEGHAVYPRHDFDSSNYRDIEAALASVYEDEFKVRLSVRFSIEADEESRWEIGGQHG